MKKTILTLSASLLIAGTANALIINGETADAQIVSGGAGDQGSAPNFFTQAGAEPMAVGRTSAGNGRNAAAIFVFQLPDLGVGNTFGTGTLTFNVASTTNSFGADLYGIDARGAATVLTSDFYFGSALDGSSDVDRLQQGILASAATGSQTSVDLTSWLNTQYDGGNNIGSYVFLRLSAANSNSNIFDTDAGFTITSADAGSNTPFLSYTAVPEPGAFALISGLFGMCYVMVRRREA
ncbi:MAG: hypothetical protein ACSHX4_03505 [Opitutaceae bacterium]